MGSNLRYESSRTSVRFLSPAIIADWDTTVILHLMVKSTQLGMPPCKTFDYIPSKGDFFVSQNYKYKTNWGETLDPPMRAKLSLVCPYAAVGSLRMIKVVSPTQCQMFGCISDAFPMPALTLLCASPQGRAQQSPKNIDSCTTWR